MQGGETGEGLQYAEDEIDNVDGVQGEDAELDRNPQHQRDAKHGAEHQSPTVTAQYQDRRREVGDTVHAQQGNAAPYEVAEEEIRKGQHLKVRQHVRHVPYLTMRVRPKQDSTAYRADTDKYTQEKQCPAGKVEFRFCFHIIFVFSPLMAIKDSPCPLKEGVLNPLIGR